MDKLEKVGEILKKELGSLIEENRSLAPLTTLRVGGPARFFVEVETISHLRKTLTICKEEKIPYFIIGRGSNILVSESGFNGLVIRLGRDFHRLHLDDEVVIAGAAVPLPELVRLAQANSLDGLAFAVGIPGSVGGAIKMNAGAFGESIGDRVIKVTVLDDEDGQLRVLQRGEIDFGYRKSNIKGVILEGTFKLKRGSKEEITQKMERYFRQRKNTQPVSFPNAGSIFKNPSGNYAAKLIEESGCKGMKRGGAQVSEHHANFIVNLGNATASDVYFLMRAVRRRVWERFGIWLEPEIVILGDFSEKG